MKKIKILLGIILCVTIFNFAKLIYYFSALNFLEELINSDTQAHLLLAVYVIALVVFFVAHVLICKGFWHIIRFGYFNPKSIKAFYLGGVLLLLFGVITLLWRLYAVLDTAHVYGDLMPHNIVQAVENGYTIILGFGLITVTSIFKDGLLIKSENDLTI